MWSDEQCSDFQGYVVEYEPFSAAWPAVDTFVPGGSGSAYQLVTTPRTFTDALALSPAPPLGRMVCWCDTHRSQVRRRLPRSAGDVRGGNWGCRFVLVVLPLTSQRRAREKTRGSQPTPLSRRDRTRGGRGRGRGRRSAVGRRSGPRGNPTQVRSNAFSFGHQIMFRIPLLAGTMECAVLSWLLSTSMILFPVRPTVLVRVFCRDARALLAFSAVSHSAQYHPISFPRVDLPCFATRPNTTTFSTMQMKRGLGRCGPVRG